MTGGATSKVSSRSSTTRYFRRCSLSVSPAGWPPAAPSGTCPARHRHFRSGGVAPPRCLGFSLGVVGSRFRCPLATGKPRLVSNISGTCPTTTTGARTTPAGVPELDRPAVDVRLDRSQQPETDRHHPPAAWPFTRWNLVRPTPVRRPSPVRHPASSVAHQCLCLQHLTGVRGRSRARRVSRR